MNLGKQFAFANRINQLAASVGKDDMDYDDYIQIAKDAVKPDWTLATLGGTLMDMDTWPRDKVAMVFIDIFEKGE